MTNQEWARLFRLLDKQGDVYVNVGEVECGRIEKVGRTRVTLRETFGYNLDLVDKDTVFLYADLNGVHFDVY